MKWKDYGESSLTLLAVHCGLDKEKPTIPYDCSDFKRCIHLFECLELNCEDRCVLLNKTSKKYPQWNPFVNNWIKLTDLYNKNKEEELYELMLKLRKEII